MEGLIKGLADVVLDRLNNDEQPNSESRDEFSRSSWAEVCNHHYSPLRSLTSCYMVDFSLIGDEMCRLCPEIRTMMIRGMIVDMATVEIIGINRFALRFGFGTVIVDFY